MNRDSLAVSLAGKPYVAWYCMQKPPEIADKVRKLVDMASEMDFKVDVKEAGGY